VPTIGWLDSQSQEAAGESVPAFQQGLAETGYVDGRNVIVVQRWHRLDERIEGLSTETGHNFSILASGAPAAPCT
jgi:hypothetical protein